MDRRELLRNSLLSFGAGLASAAPASSAPGQRAEPDMLGCQQCMGNPGEAHADAMGRALSPCATAVRY